MTDEHLEQYDDEDDICPECGQGPYDCRCDDASSGNECGRRDQSYPGGMLPVGMCRKGGTEECDFECPYRDGSEP